MMKLFILILFTCSHFASLSQNVDSIAITNYNYIAESNNGILNLTDTNGLKQGLWLHYTMFFDSRCSALSTQESDTCFRKKSQGEYLNDKKTGKWNYYDDGGCYLAIKRTEHYNKDGSFDLIRDNLKVHYNLDSTKVTAHTTTSKDTVIITCENKLCKTTFDEYTLFQFKQESDNLEIEFIKVEGGVYYDKIRKIKN